MATRPLGPIQLLSNAYLKKNVVAQSKATMPMRCSQRPPIIVSQSSVEEDLACEALTGGTAKTLDSGGCAVSSRGLGIPGGETEGVGTVCTEGGTAVVGG